MKNSVLILNQGIARSLRGLGDGGGEGASSGGAAPGGGAAAPSSETPTTTGSGFAQGKVQDFINYGWSTAVSAGTSQPTVNMADEAANTILKASIAVQQIPALGYAVGAVLLVVGAAVKFLALTFGNGPTSKEALAQVNGNAAALLIQIDSANGYIQRMEAGLTSLKKVLNQNGFSGLSGFRGLGSTLINDAVAATGVSNSIPMLQQTLADKGKYLQYLIGVFNQTINDVYKAVTTKNRGQKIVMIGLIAVALGGITWYALSNRNGK